MKRETLKVTWKIVRRKGYGRTPETYCSYIVENKNRKHRLRTNIGTGLFELLNNTHISESGTAEIQMDGMYIGDKLMYVCDFRRTK